MLIPRKQQKHHHSQSLAVCFRLNLFVIVPNHSHRKSQCNHCLDSLEGENPEVLWSYFEVEVHCHRHPADGLRESSRHSTRLRRHDDAMMSRLSAWKNVHLTFPFKQKQKIVFMRKSKIWKKYSVTYFSLLFSSL